jgi:hypothetical protein
MKVKDLLDEINRSTKEYGDDFLNWDVYTEQIDAVDKQTKKGADFGGNWKHIADEDEFEYFYCAGFWTKFPHDKIFTINVNF